MKRNQVEPVQKTLSCDLPDILSTFTLDVEDSLQLWDYTDLVVKVLASIRLEIPIENQNISIKVCNSAESKKTNKKFRSKNKSTNVLAFPCGNDIFSLPNHLGDILICDEVVLSEAKFLDIDFEERFSRMLIHGILHLKGYLHDSKSSADIMEELESKIMVQLGYSNPYV